VDLEAISPCGMSMIWDRKRYCFASK